jgi:hypothetical protein
MPTGFYTDIAGYIPQFAHKTTPVRWILRTRDGRHARIRNRVQQEGCAHLKRNKKRLIDYYDVEPMVTVTAIGASRPGYLTACAEGRVGRP